jgi:hypothetical protein
MGAAQPRWKIERHQPHDAVTPSSHTISVPTAFEGIQYMTLWDVLLIPASLLQSGL